MYNLAERAMSVTGRYVQSSWAHIACGALCAAPAIESALHAISNIGTLLTTKRENAVTFRGYPLDKKTDMSYELSKNLGTAIFYGLCAAEVIPYSTPIGATVFTVYTLVRGGDNDAYYTSQILKKPVTLLASGVAWPVVKATAKIAGNILLTAAEMAGSILKNIPLPNHPIWVGVVLLGAGGLVYNYSLPVIFGQQTHAQRVPGQ